MRKLFLFFLFALLVVLPSMLRADTVVEEIIARVNNSVITKTEYLRSRTELKQELQERDPANADKLFSERQSDILRDLIDQELLIDKGADMGITGDTELIKRLDEMRKQSHFETMDDLQKAAEAQGVSFEDFKQHIKTQIIKEQVIGHEVGGRLNITKEEEQKFYEEHKSELVQPEQIRLSELLISTEQAKDDQQLNAAKAQADDLLAQIRKGGNFEELTKKHSNGPTAAQGGDLGYFKRGALAKQLEDLTFAMKAGDTSDIVRTKQGYVILKVTEHHAGGIPSLKEVEPKVMDAIYMQKVQPALRAYLKKLREEAYIDVKPGYVDSAASPNETKPIETAAKDPNAKKLKKKKKLGVI
jgi:peptidyl-prolyl cis-trans isomerase SurA